MPRVCEGRRAAQRLMRAPPAVAATGLLRAPPAVAATGVLRVGVAGLAVTLAAGCGGEGGAPAQRGEHPGERRFEEVRVDTLWTRGSLADTVIELPLYLIADAEYVVLADGARRGVAALHVADGSTAWTTGRQGRGPGEFERPAVLEFLPDARLLVADTEVGRVTVLERDGRHASEFPLEDAHVTGLCALADGNLVVVATTDGANFRTLTPEGEPLAQHAAPWPELREESQLTRQFVVSTPPDRRECLFALSIGRGFGSFDGRSFGFTQDYVEGVRTPEVEVRASETLSRRDRAERLDRATLSTRAIAADAEHLYVAFEGATAEAGRIIDVYTRSGSYQHSFRLPRRVQKLAWANDVFYVLSLDQGVPHVSALRIRRAS